MRIATLSSLSLVWGLLLVSCTPSTDILVVGGGAGGVCTAVQASRMGKDVTIVEETAWLGGMLTSAGVSAIDGNYLLHSGIFWEMVEYLKDYYGSYEALQSGWVSNVLFEPHVAEEFLEDIASSCNIVHASFIGARKLGKGWKVDLEKDGRRMSIRTRLLVDATETMDVASKLGAGWRKGMDKRGDTGERIASETGSPAIQDLTYCLTVKDYGVDMTIPRPEGYDPTIYYNCCISPNNHDVEIVGERVVKSDTRQTVSTREMMLTYGELPTKGGGRKFMINWPGEGNDTFVDVVDVDPETRRHLLDSAKSISLGFLYYMQTELGLNTLGLADDEYPTEDLLPLIPYHREGRRLVGKVTFTLEDLTYPFSSNLYRTGIAVGDYPVDHHHYRNSRWMDLPKLEFYPVPSYNVPLGVTIPKDTPDLLVADKGISVTNLVNGTTRLQPVVMLVGQAVGALSALSLDKGGIDKVTPRDVQRVLLESGAFIMPYCDVAKESPYFDAVQRIGACGILRGDPHPQGWENMTFFRPEDPVREDEVFLEDYFPGKTLQDLGIEVTESTTRQELAGRIDSILQPFDREVSLYGDLL